MDRKTEGKGRRRRSGYLRALNVQLQDGVAAALIGLTRLILQMFGSN